MIRRSTIPITDREDIDSPAGAADDRRTEFAHRLRSHQTQLFGYIYSLVRNLDDADDLFQQMSLVLWDKFDQFDSSRSFVNWACGVARYEVLNFVRARGRNRLCFSDELSLVLVEAQESLEHERLEERRDALAGCMKKLRQQDRQLVEDCYARPASIPDVARSAGRSTQSIHNSLRRIRRSLFECVQHRLAQGGLS